MRLFHQFCEKNNMLHNNDQIFQYLQTYEEKETAKQLSIWDMIL